MFPFGFWTSTAEFESRLQATEAKLLEFARRDNERMELTTLDTEIPRSAVPCLKPAQNEKDQTLTIHSIRAVSKDSGEKSEYPLVKLHGYMNAATHFYRNVGGLCQYFSSVYGVDMLGWGQSTRVPFHQVKESGTLQSAEDFFVESLEAWRIANNIEKMILSGHSFGCYIAVAYAERYPDRVDRLILLSPFGVPDPADPDMQERFERFRSSLRGQLFLGTFKIFFNWTTPGAVIRSFTELRGLTMARSYVERRLPEIKDPEEVETLADFYYLNVVVPPSGEYFLQSLFTDFFAKEPLMYRIPSLKVQSVNFLYGTTDWMDVSGAMRTQTLCHRLSKQLKQDGSSFSTTDISVHLVPNAGHLLTLQNPEIVNACMIRIAGGRIKVPEENMPALVDLDETKHLDESWVTRAREIFEDREKRIVA